MPGPLLESRWPPRVTGEYGAALRLASARHPAICGIDIHGSSEIARIGSKDALRPGAAQLTPSHRQVAGRLTCAGGTAVIDMMIHLVAREGGELLAAEVAEQMLVGRPRSPTQRQLADSGAMPDGGSELIRAAATLMKQNPDDPLSAPEIARQLGVSTRHLRRQFRELLGTTTIRYYLRMRLVRAHNLLEQTELSVTEVALACGFGSLEHFSRAYRTMFGCAPSRDRSQTMAAPIYRSGYRLGLARAEAPHREAHRARRRRHS